jgi:hypothetical protein
MSRTVAALLAICLLVPYAVSAAAWDTNQPFAPILSPTSYSEQAIPAGLPAAFTAVDRVVNRKAAVRFRKAAGLRRPRRRHPNGRFAFEEGGSPEDVLLNFYLDYKPGVWLLPSDYHERFLPNVMIETIRSDFSKNFDSGYMARRINVGQYNAYEYKLTELGKQKARALIKGRGPQTATSALGLPAPVLSSDALVRLSANQRRVYMTQFLKFVAPPAVFSRRWWAWLNSGSPSPEAATAAVLELYRRNKDEFEALFDDWLSHQKPAAVAGLRNLILERQSRFFSQLDRPAQSAEESARENLVQYLNEIANRVNPHNDLIKRFTEIRNNYFWGFNAADLTRQNAAELIMRVLEEYGFRPSKTDPRNLEQATWIFPGNIPLCVQRLVEVQDPSSSQERQNAVVVIQQLKDTFEQSADMRVALEEVNFEDENLINISRAILRAYGYESNGQLGEHWSAALVPSIIRDLPIVLHLYEQSQARQVNALEDLQLLKKPLSFIVEQLIKRPDSDAESIPGAVPGRSLGQPTSPNQAQIERYREVYAPLESEDKAVMLSDLIGQLKALSRWSVQPARALEDVMLELVMGELSQSQAQDVIARALMVQHASRRLRHILPERARAMRISEGVLELLGAISKRDKRRRKAAEEAMQNYAHYQGVVKVRSGVRIDDELPLPWVGGMTAPNAVVPPLLPLSDEPPVMDPAVSGRRLLTSA